MKMRELRLLKCNDNRAKETKNKIMKQTKWIMYKNTQKMFFAKNEHWILLLYEVWTMRKDMCIHNLLLIYYSVSICNGNQKNLYLINKNLIK